MKKKINLKKILKRIGLLILILIITLICVVLYANWKIPNDTQSFVFDNVNNVPEQKVALILGTSKRLRGGYANPYFTNRIKAAAELYEAGKVKAFVVSGDNRTLSYNEPKDMQKALIEKGIPDSIIYLDCLSA